MLQCEIPGKAGKPSHRYTIANPERVHSPGLVLFRDVLLANLRWMLDVAGDPARLRPHCKSHKMIDVVRLLIEAGIYKHKCATFAEAEMLATGGARDVFLAYNPVGPNIARAVRFRQQFPGVRFAVTADHPDSLDALNRAMADAGQQIDVFIDLDPGMGRTGLPPGPDARDLYLRMRAASHVCPAGIHLYDGQNHQADLPTRQRAAEASWQLGREFRAALAADGIEVPTIVTGGTPTFTLHAMRDDPAVELSPGTCLLQDARYLDDYPEIECLPAALLLTRVISRPHPDRVTFDLGTKACAADTAAGNRLRFPAIPDAREILHNEEHLVIETDQAHCFRPGDATLAVPMHICPTPALHASVHVVTDGQVDGEWPVTARDRKLTI